MSSAIFLMLSRVPPLYLFLLEMECLNLFSALDSLLSFCWCLFLSCFSHFAFFRVGSLSFTLF